MPSDERCVSPETKEECQAAVAAAGLREGGCGYAFAGNYGSGAGCYTYSSGSLYEGCGYWSSSGNPTGNPGSSRVRVQLCTSFTVQEGRCYARDQMSTITHGAYCSGSCCHARETASSCYGCCYGAEIPYDGGSSMGVVITYREAYNGQPESYSCMCIYLGDTDKNSIWSPSSRCMRPVGESKIVRFARRRTCSDRSLWAMQETHRDIGGVPRHGLVFYE